MKRYPRITVVTPSFNQAHFLEQTIQSVALQKYPNLQYIIVDGGSTDGSLEIIRKYAHLVSHWISERDLGPADAINKGFQEADGSIMAYLNADDTYAQGALAAVAKTFDSFRHDDVVYGNTYWIDREGKRLAEKRQTPFSKWSYLYGGADLQQPATFWRREIFERAGGVDSSFRAAFDTDLFFRFIALGARFKYINAFLASFRVHSSQISALMMDTTRSELSILREKHLAYPINSFKGKLIRNLGRTQRVLWYLRQGDIFWLVRRVPDRLKSRADNEAAGPRSKWI